MMNEQLNTETNYYSQIRSVDLQQDLSVKDKYIRLKKILERICKDITENESLQFPSLFSRLVFIGQKYELPALLIRQLHELRIKTTLLLSNKSDSVSAHHYKEAKEAIENLLLYIEGKRTNFEYVEDTLIEPEVVQDTSLRKMRVQLLSTDKVNKILLCQSETSLENTIKVKYDVATVNKEFTATVEQFWVGAQLNLIDVGIDESGNYIPKRFVLEPDYLIDASAIAECFQSYGSSYLHYFRRKMEPNVSTHYILLGNLANFFLDELVYAEQPQLTTFKDTFLKSFRSMPFEYASCEGIQANSDFKEFMVKAEKHFENIKRVILYDMPASGFDIKKCILEPSFFCEKFGFQGRLDLLQLSDDKEGVSRIIELKSGKPPYPVEDTSKIAVNHETQTAVYRLMIQSVFDEDARHIYPMILYSAPENKGENLRFAAKYNQLECDIIDTRNKIIIAEHDLYTGSISSTEIFFEQLFNIDNYGRVPQFFTDKLIHLEEIFKKASSLERRYFFRFVNFVSRELYLQKVGDDSYNSIMSISALWNTVFEERQEALELITDLEIEHIDDSGRDMVIHFKQSRNTDCVNFRVGEICILYPRQKDADTILTNQILKGTIVKITSWEVILRFRYKQKNRNLFSQYRYWTVEHDKLDHAFNAMFKSLYAFLTAPKYKKDLLLGLSSPHSSSEFQSDLLRNLSIEEKEADVIDKALSSDDYFLIVGPPGTGKTSIFVRKLIERLYQDKHKNILVIAYTNRAVDELCSAISDAFGEEASVCEKYIRIGSELSCGESYRHRLLQNISHKANTRTELRQAINATRIFVGTLASINGKPEIFSLKKFDVAIIDEASQILEPQIIGLLPQFDKFIMIGDHKQLSTITLQDKTKSNVEEHDLNEIGLYDCRESLFERLFHVCQIKGWGQRYDTLTYHGRMHQKIASLVNNTFYDGKLQEATERQILPFYFPEYDQTNNYQTLVANHRLGFIDVHKTDETNRSDKTNRYEVSEVVSLAKALLEVYRLNGVGFDSQKTLGIITPYRNQIALIKHKLEETRIPELADIMVDTVERYQGSQRDVIIVSFCFNYPYQMQYFNHMNRDNSVDRKLNVALTRAREQLFLVGNKSILVQNAIYNTILEKFANKK